MGTSNTKAHAAAPAGLPQARKYMRPLPEDTWETIAARELTDLSADDAPGVLQSWNFHVFMRPAPPEDSPRVGNPILPSDIIFLEPPAAAS